MQRGDARFSLGLERQQAKSTPAPLPRPPPPHVPFRFQTVGAVEGGQESLRCVEVLKILATFTPLTLGDVAPERPSGKLTFCSSLEECSLQMLSQMAS